MQKHSDNIASCILAIIVILYFLDNHYIEQLIRPSNIE